MCRIFTLGEIIGAKMHNTFLFEFALKTSFYSFKIKYGVLIKIVIFHNAPKPKTAVLKTKEIGTNHILPCNHRND